jgi:hypothetical protein
MGMVSGRRSLGGAESPMGSVKLCCIDRFLWGVRARGQDLHEHIHQMTARSQGTGEALMQDLTPAS